MAASARFGITLALCALVAGCGDAPIEETAATTVAPRAPNDFTAAVSTGTGDVASTLQFQLVERPAVGQPVTVRFKINPSAPAQKIQVVFEVEEGLQFVDELRATVLLDARSPGSEVHELQVVPSRAGVLLLKSTVMTETDRGAKSTDFAIPLLVGDASAAADAAAPAQGS